MVECRGSAMAGMWITRLGIKTSSLPHTGAGVGADHGWKPRSDQVGDALCASIWESLSDDVLDKILVRLPLQSLVRMQSVCKRWRIKVRNKAFIRQCEQQEKMSSPQWYLTFADATSTCNAYEVETSKWHAISLGFLPFKSSIKPLAAADGLVCLSVGARHLVVCNPVTRFWREVPTAELSDVSVAALAVDRVRGTYKLLLVGEDHRHESCTKRLVAFVFESASHSWCTVETDLLEPPQLNSFSFLLSHLRAGAHLQARALVGAAAVCDGVLFCLAARPYELHAFDVRSEEWARLHVTLPAEISGVCSLLVPRPGRLFLVGAYRHNPQDKGSNVGIWELDRSIESNSIRWRAVDVLLDHEGWCTSAPQRSLSAGSQDVLLFMKWATRFLAYNVSTKSWAWLPPQAQQVQQEGFLFSPSLLLP